MRRTAHRSIRLGNGKTSFLDITKSITNKSKDPVTIGGYCIIYVARLKGEGNVALKKIRGSKEKWQKV